MQNWCAFASDLYDVTISWQSAYTVCEYEVSYRCPYGWTYYRDDGSEGWDSCVLMSSSNATSWAVANSSCPAGSHLLTIGSSLSSTGLTAFASSLYNNAGQYVYIGCSQNSSASSAGSGWSWVDSTNSSYLNCGGGIGCYLWNSSQPR